VAFLQRRGEDHRERSHCDSREGTPAPASGRRGSLRPAWSVRHPGPGNAASGSCRPGRVPDDSGVSRREGMDSRGRRRLRDLRRYSRGRRGSHQVEDPGGKRRSRISRITRSLVQILAFSTRKGRGLRLMQRGHANALSSYGRKATHNHTTGIKRTEAAGLLRKLRGCLAFVVL